MFCSSENCSPSVSTFVNQLYYSKKEKFAIEIRCRDRGIVLSQKRANVLNFLQMERNFQEPEAKALLEQLETFISTQNYEEGLNSFQKIKKLIQKDDHHLQTLLKSGLMEVCSSFLEAACAPITDKATVVTCLEIVSWITISITAGNETTGLNNSEILKNYISFLLNNTLMINAEILENILMTFYNILEDEFFEDFEELHENPEVFQKLTACKELFSGKESTRLVIFPQFLKRFTHHAFFYKIEHELNFVFNLIRLNIICIHDFPDNLITLTPDDEDYLNSAFTSLIDCVTFIDPEQFFFVVVQDLDFLSKAMSLLQNYSNIMENSSSIFKFILLLLERMEREQTICFLLGMDQIFLQILVNSQKNNVIEKTIECVDLMMENSDDYSSLFRVFKNVALIHFENPNLQIKHQIVEFFCCILSKASLSLSVEDALLLFEYFNEGHLYQEIIALVDSEIPDMILQVLNFLKLYLEMGRFFQEEKDLPENICAVRIWVKKFFETRIENLNLHPNEAIATLSIQIFEDYLGEK